MSFGMKLKDVCDILNVFHNIKSKLIFGGITMNKTEFINAVAAKGEMDKKAAEKAVNAVFGAVADALKAGDKVQLVGFGTFEVKTRGERTGRNPKTGETIKVPASKHPAFSASKALKEQLN
jgi:DNA-binding protein HU-beta